MLQEFFWRGIGHVRLLLAEVVLDIDHLYYTYTISFYIFIIVFIAAALE